ncbi:hypothetical protein KY290_004534 [Solanum tuberosum]|uniref:Uncharacterized protein n=1 Tax=Solanum tuberosum TaxID=4113 RepID=A0ABQ7WXJ4_SOLTU|nr:hypothetical protein KY290_004534 [Solanum tuberosum]
MFKGLRCELKDIITTLSARQEPVTFGELHRLLLSHEFIHANGLLKRSVNKTIIIIEDASVTIRVEAVIVVEDKDIEEAHLLEIHGPHLTLAHDVKYSPPISHQNWYPDSGATHHITPDLSNLHNVEDYKGMYQVHIGNGQGLPIHNTGRLFFHAGVMMDSSHSISNHPTRNHPPSHHQLSSQPGRHLHVGIIT